MNNFEVGHEVAVRRNTRWHPARVVEVYPLAVAVHLLDHVATGNPVVDNWHSRWMIPLIVDADIEPPIMHLVWET